MVEIDRRTPQQPPRWSQPGSWCRRRRRAEAGSVPQPAVASASGPSGAASATTALAGAAVTVGQSTGYTISSPAPVRRPSPRRCTPPAAARATRCLRRGAHELLHALRATAGSVRALAFVDGSATTRPWWASPRGHRSRSTRTTPSPSASRFLREPSWGSPWTRAPCSAPHRGPAGRPAGVRLAVQPGHVDRHVLRAGVQLPAGHLRRPRAGRRRRQLRRRVPGPVPTVGRDPGRLPGTRHDGDQEAEEEVDQAQGQDQLLLERPRVDVHVRGGQARPRSRARRRSRRSSSTASTRS